MAAGENCFTAELTEDEVTKLLENAAKFGTKYLMENACKCTTNATERALFKGSLKQFTGKSGNQYRSAQICSKWINYTTNLSLPYSVLLPCISKRLVNSSWTKLLRSAQ